MYSTRAEARNAGELTYMTGVSCPNGHIDVRYVSTAQCKSCVRESARMQHRNVSGQTRKRWTTETIVAAFTETHGSVYNYENSKYVAHKTKVQVVCSAHGPFMVTPDNHIQGKGCPKCADERVGNICRSTTERFISSAILIWGDRWDYSQCIYIGSHDKLTIRCKDHGAFEQTPTNHLSQKVACAKCNHMSSKEEDAIFRYTSIFTRSIQRDRTILKPKELDVYMPDKNLAIEYAGMYWHSHFDAEAEKRDKSKHADKHSTCAEQGIRLITIYESEWQERKPQIKRLIRNAIGASRGKLMARKCESRRVDTKEARVFFDRYHPQGGAGGGEHYGLYWKGKLVACMRFAYGQNDRGAGAESRSWTLGRYATRVQVAGAASRLFKAFVVDKNPPCVKSFSDNRYFAGGMYAQLGFILEADVKADYSVWSPKVGIQPKPHYQRRMIPKRLLEHSKEDIFDPATDLRTEAQMTYLMGCGRIYDCGKKRWVWTKS